MTTAARPKPAEGPRGVRLRDALLARFRPGAKELAVSVPGLDNAAPTERIVQRESVMALVTDPERWPDLSSLEAYAIAVGWTFEAVVADLGQHARRSMCRDLHGLPRHRALLRANLTTIERGPLPIVGRTHLPVPVAMDEATPFRSGALEDLLFGGQDESAEDLALASPSWRLSARAGDCENRAYPRVPARAWLRVDRRQTTLTPDGIFLILHGQVVSICAAHDDGTAITLLPDPGSGYRSQRLSRREATVLGRVVAIAGDIGRCLPPSPPAGLQLGAGFATVAGVHASTEINPSHPGKQMLSQAWHRRGLSYNEHGRWAKNRSRHVFGRTRGGQSGATMHSYLGNPAPHAPRPRFETFYQQAASFDVDYQDLLRAFGISSSVLADRGPSTGADAPLDAIARLRAHPFGDYLEDLGWDLPWLCAVHAEAGAGKIYHLGGPLVPGWAPLLKPGAFVVVDERPFARRIPRLTPGARRDWERPLYLLRLKSGPRFLCGHCETVRDGIIRALPHPDDPSGIVRDFKQDIDARVVGRVRRVATLI